MLFRRLSAQRTVFVVCFVGGLLVATHQVLGGPQTRQESTPTKSTSKKDQAWKMPIDWPNIGSFWDKEEDGNPLAHCPPAQGAQQPVVKHEPEKLPPPKSKMAFSAKGEDDPLKMTRLLKHAPGWTIFDNIYMSGGTMYIVTEKAADWPAIRLMTSTGLRAENTPENIASREPTDRDMRIITMREAEEMWGKRVWPVNGLSFLVNDPGQFVSHYYHFVAETWMGLWRLYSSLDSDINPQGETTLDGPSRVLFPHCKETEWRDYSTFNQYFMHAVFPSISLETQLDWEGRSKMTESKGPGTAKVFRFERVVLSDRSAAFRGELCPSRNNRIVSEAWAATKKESSKYWWEPVRRSVLRFAGVDQKTMDLNVVWAKEWAGTANGDEVPTPQQIDVAKSASRRMPVVITYVVRGGDRRAMIKEDHEALVEALTQLCEKKRWELNVVHAERLTKDEQIQLAGRTTIMLGIHGNGLTHLVWMPLTPLTTVIEIFIPGGFAKDYEWTARALGMRHYAVWNDTYFTHPEDPSVAYPEGFQGNQIPAHGPTIAKLIEDRIEGRLP